MSRPRGAFDFETYDWVNPLCYALRWGPYGERETHFYRMQDKGNPAEVAVNCLNVMRIIAESGGPVEWWAHNGGKFDTLFLLAAAQRMGWIVSANVTGGGRIVTATFRASNSKTTLHMRDSYAVVQSTLKNAVKDFQCEAAKTFTDDDYSRDMRTLPLTELERGCVQDCECVLQLLDKVETLAEQWGGALKSTFSSIALGIVKSEVDLPSHEDNQAVNAWCRKAYLGGRVEVFRHSPQEWLTEYDCNSSYPASLAESLPWDYSRTEDRPHALRAHMSDGDESIIEATVTVSREHLPVLPYRPLETGGVYFPWGTWKGRFAKTELLYAVECGSARIDKLHSAAIYKSETKLADFVNRLYQTKQGAVGAVRMFAKLSLNGCYGKFGQKPERERIQLMDSEFEAYALAFERKTKRIDPNNPLALTVFEERWPKQTHYALASYITANARIRLHRALNASTGIAYCDTDSVHAAQFPYRLEGSGLGEWKQEIKRLKGEYYAPKIYRLKDENGKVTLAAKGFHIRPKNDSAEEKARVNGLFDAIIAGDGIAQHTIRGARGQLRNGNIPESLDLLKSWHGVSSKRKFLGGIDGQTSPWSVSELEAGLHLKQRIARE